VAAWGVLSSTGQFDVNPALVSRFVPDSMTGLAGSGNTLYAYVPTGNSAFVLPMNCVSSNSPAISSLSVVNQGGTALSSGASVFLGDTVTITPTINPPPSLQPLTGFAWRFDYDFHAGVPYDDNGTGASPRLNAPDLSNGTPPSEITLVGPCDPQVGATTPATGVGCWNSVTTNSSFGGPDFGPTPLAGATRPLTLAFEAHNALGDAGAGLFTLNWTVPAIRLKSTQILTGGAVDATGSDGHPSLLSGGYLWYFGIDPSAPAGETLFVDPGCTGPTCAHAFFGSGTRNFNVWVSVPYSNGFTSPDCPGLPTACVPPTPLKVQVADVLPKFLVNGHSGPPIVVLLGSAMTITNQTTFGSVTGVSYAYGLCTDVTGAAPACQPSNTLGFSGSTGTITAPPATGSWYLFFRVNYNGGSFIDWQPSIPGVSNPKAFPISASNVIPQIHVFINGVDPCAPGFSCNPNEVDAFTGDTLTAWSYVGGTKDPQQPAISWSFPGASPSSGSVPAWAGAGFNDVGVNFSYGTGGSYTITMNGYGTPYSVSAVITQRTNPLSVTVAATPNPATVNTSVAFACHASGGSGSGYTYNWSNAFSATGPNTSHTFTAASTYTEQCTVTDSASHTAGAVVNVSVTSGGGGGTNCPNTDFHITVDGGPQFPPSFSVPAGHLVTFLPALNYATYVWSFGDGSPTATTQSATHSYATGGTYTASLTANGCTRSYSIVVTGGGGGGPAPACATVDFSILDESTTPPLPACGAFGCNAISGEALTFVPTASTTVTSWNFGDGSPTTSSNPGTHTYSGGGTFNVTLTAGSCTKVYALSISGPLALTGGFTEKYADNSTLAAASVASGKDIAFLATDTADTYTWDFGDGTAPVTGQTPTHSFFTLTGVANSTYTVTLSVTRGTGTSAQSASTSQLFTIIPPPAPPTWFVAGLAYLNGTIPGTLWQSDVTIFNPDPARSASYSVAFLDGRNPIDTSNISWISGVNLGPQQSISSPNILAGFFGKPLGSYGALIVRGDVAPVPPVITSRTFNTGDPTKGTFGLSVPSTQPASGLSPQTALSQQLLIGLRQDTTSYTNVGLMNLTTDWSHAQLTFFDQSASLLGQMNVDVPPYGVAQLSTPLTAAPPSGLGLPGPLDAFTVRVSILSGGALFPYATVIDRQSTDSIVVTASDHPSSTYRMPGIIRLAGVNNTVWRSRFYVNNPSTNPRSVSLSYSFIPCDATGCKGRVTGLQNDVVMQPGQTLWVDDFPAYWLGTVFGFAVSDTTAYQASYIDVAPSAGDPNQDPLLVLGETYNDQPTGPVGLQVPGFSAADAASATGANKRLLLGGLVSNDSFRTNVALFLQSGSTGSCTVHVLSPTGTELAHQDVAFNGATTFVQLNDSGLFAPIPGSKDRLTVVVDSFVGSPISGYATIVDNISGDATFVKAQPGP
jgi:PKD repeat protein